ncbi:PLASMODESMATA CALLOSE-BINDING PROTEIN 3-like [Magnolia sinica]|uniref:PLASMODESMATA CALLOSE-BINDING PROTEIN 3-like n=1 Tax=Magnolia sinica TaxID=86752 RepID=UPI00265A14C0|nr:PLASMODESMATA CALLOSE-BINDING PROTEIN 3-like [Magnolia sinica]
MAILILLVLILAMAGGSGATWCVCRSDVSDAALQKTLDYACGAGADCNPIHQNGACYNPNTVRGHCSYAVNSYFQKKGQSQGTCDFAGTATAVTADPSSTGCVYPSTQSAAGTTPTTSTTTPTTTSPLTPTTTTTNTPTTGVMGGINPGLGPSGGINNDFNGGFLPKAGLGPIFLAILFSILVMFRG